MMGGGENAGGKNKMQVFKITGLERAFLHILNEFEQV